MPSHAHACGRGWQAHNQLAPSNDAVRDLEINFKALLRRMRIMDVAYLKVLKADEHGDDAGKVEQVQASFTISGGKRLDTTLHEIQGLMHETGLEPGAENLSDVTTRYSIWVLDLVQQYPFAPKSEDKRKTFKGEILSYQQIRSKVHEGATLTADYIVFTVCAGIISAVGLGRDDFVATVASMLVSPLMGPILGITFGFWENDVQLVLRSLRNEFIGLVLCIVVGLITGLVVAEWAEDDWDWPTEFMSSRGEPMSLAVGLAIAIPSGAGVARSITTANAGGLIGVAISASLLPPTVNAGMCWAVAAFSDDEHRAIARTGGYSLLLTIVNIMAIILAALVAWYFQLRRLKEQWGQRAGAEVYSTNALRRDEAEQLKAKYTAQRTSEAERPIDEDAEGKRPIDGDADTECELACSAMRCPCRTKRWAGRAGARSSSLVARCSDPCTALPCLHVRGAPAPAHLACSVSQKRAGATARQRSEYRFRCEGAHPQSQSRWHLPKEIFDQADQHLVSDDPGVCVEPVPT